MGLMELNVSITLSRGGFWRFQESITDIEIPCDPQKMM